MGSCHGYDAEGHRIFSGNCYSGGHVDPPTTTTCSPGDDTCVPAGQHTLNTPINSGENGYRLGGNNLQSGFDLEVHGPGISTGWIVGATDGLNTFQHLQTIMTHATTTTVPITAKSCPPQNSRCQTTMGAMRLMRAAIGRIATMKRSCCRPGSVWRTVFAAAAISCVSCSVVKFNRDSERDSRPAQKTSFPPLPIIDYENEPRPIGGKELAGLIVTQYPEVPPVYSDRASRMRAYSGRHPASVQFVYWDGTIRKCEYYPNGKPIPPYTTGRMTVTDAPPTTLNAGDPRWNLVDFRWGSDSTFNSHADPRAQAIR